jgi:hypothetical protein
MIPNLNPRRPPCQKPQPAIGHWMRPRAIGEMAWPIRKTRGLRDRGQVGSRDSGDEVRGGAVQAGGTGEEGGVVSPDVRARRRKKPWTSAGL